MSFANQHETESSSGWSRFCDKHWYHEELGFWLDVSQMKSNRNQLEELESKFPNICKAMKELEFCDTSIRNLTPIQAYDIVMHSADAVISGGVRRSATICVFSPDDEEMAAAKTGNWFHENPQRGRSNNSALLLRDKTTAEQFSELMKSVKEFGEPGFVWSDSTELIVNPCVEIGLYPVDEETGETGWQACSSTGLET